jgi:hypothetical protein
MEYYGGVGGASATRIDLVQISTIMFTVWFLYIDVVLSTVHHKTRGHWKQFIAQMNLNKYEYEILITISDRKRNPSMERHIYFQGLSSV